MNNGTATLSIAALDKMKLDIVVVLSLCCVALLSVVELKVVLLSVVLIVVASYHYRH